MALLSIIAVFIYFNIVVGEHPRTFEACKVSPPAECTIKDTSNFFYYNADTGSCEAAIWRDECRGRKQNNTNFFRQIGCCEEFCVNRYRIYPEEDCNVKPLERCIGKGNFRCLLNRQESDQCVSRFYYFNPDVQTCVAALWLEECRNDYRSLNWFTSMENCDHFCPTNRR